ncbi:hypothetical protein N752_11295 [Desulforamulus aquiferis]|nr:hypothetical protein N752_11295 [Desulforamulus aquiferis]
MDAMSEPIYNLLKEDLELLDMAGDAFDQEMVHRGELTPVFFGSALTNFGVGAFLETFIELAPQPHEKHPILVLYNRSILSSQALFLKFKLIWIRLTGIGLPLFEYVQVFSKGVWWLNMFLQAKVLGYLNLNNLWPKMPPP